MVRKFTANNVNEARDLAVQTVYEVTEKGAYANLAIDKTLRESKLNNMDRSLFTELVNGTIRMLKHLDWVLDFFLKQKITTQNPWLRSILRVAAYQIIFMDRVPDFASVNDAVEIARRRCNENLARVVNGVLRNLIRQQENITYPPSHSPEYLAIYYSHPPEMVDYLLYHFSRQETIDILKYNNQPARLDLRVNILKTSREVLISLLQESKVNCYPSPNLPHGIRVESLEQPLEKLSAYKKGFFYVQNEASMLAGYILAPESGEVIVDLCCGLGGKTTHIAELMGNRGFIKAFDSYNHKIKILKVNCSRLGINIVDERVKDVLLMEEQPTACRVLLDVPCSGTGVLNRRSDARWKKHEEQVEQISHLQYQMLQKAAAMISPGGYLLYSTCSIRKEENEEVVYAFLSDSNNNYDLLGFEDRISFFPLDLKDKKSAAQGMLTILPGKYNCDGMFYALLRRKQ